MGNITALKRGSLNGLRRQTNECLVSAYNKGYKDGKRKALEQQPCDDCENNDGECCRLLFEKSFNKDCVSRQAVLDCLTATGLKKFDFILDAREKVNNLPPVTPARKSGLHWIERFDNEDKWLECPHCHKDSDNAYNYCPNCGAYMRSNENEKDTNVVY